MILSNKLGALGLVIADAMGEALGDVSQSAAALLLTLHYRPGLTATELAAIAGVAQPTAARVLDGLARRGWLARREREGRAAPLELTETGVARARALQEARLDALKRLLAPLTETERRAFETALDAMLFAATISRAFARISCRLCDHPNCPEEACPLGSRAAEIEPAETGETPC